MIYIGKTEQLSILGLIGLFILIASAYFNPIILQNTALSDFSFNGVVPKVGAVLAFVGFFAFFHNAPQSYKELSPNIFRVIYILLFAAVSYCSESQWECFT